MTDNRMLRGWGPFADLAAPIPGVVNVLNWLKNLAE